MLEISKLPSYLSPSALNQAEKMPNFFYLTRLFNPPMERDPQPEPAAIGTMFDILIKQQLIADRFPTKVKLMSDIKSSLEIDTPEIRKKGKDIFNEYMQLAYEPEEYFDVELQHFKKIEGLSLFGKLDASVLDVSTDMEIPFDWKVSGSTSKSGVSPKKGYYQVIKGMKIKPSHKDYSSEIEMGQIDEMWATQGCTYGWLLGIPIGTEFHTRFDQIACRPKSMAIAKYRGLITEKFQEQTYNRYEKLWKEINDGTFIDRLASPIDIGLVILESLNESWI